MGCMAASLYNHQNIGRTGLFIPSNSLLFIVLVVLAFSIWLYALKKGHGLQLRLNVAPVLMAPIGFAVAGLLVGVQSPTNWLLIILFLLSAPVFVLSILYLYSSHRSLKPLLFFLLLVLGVHGLIGVLQLLAPGWGQGWIPKPEIPSPQGLYMQPNMQASMMATAVVLGFYLLLQQPVSQHRFGYKLVISIVLMLANFNIFSAGSRVGLLGLILGVLVLAVTNFHRFRLKPLITLSCVMACVLGGMAGSMSGDGLFRAYSKIERLAAEGSDVRPHIYRISWEAFKDAPLAGHGIGSFEGVFKRKAAEYQAEKGGRNLIGFVNYGHPHNELLQWAIEGGLIALSVIIIAAVSVFSRLFKMGWSRGGALLALLLPIALHTQVELPFYISAFHWLVWLLFLAMVFIGCQEKIIFNWSRPKRILISILGLMLAVPLQLFLVHSLYASKALVFALHDYNYSIHYLNKIGINPYFTDFVNENIMRTLYFHDRNSDGQYGAVMYINWAEEYLLRRPVAILHRDLIDAYLYTEQYERAIDEAEYAKYLYTNDPIITDFIQESVISDKVN